MNIFLKMHVGDLTVNWLNFLGVYPVSRGHGDFYPETLKKKTLTQIQNKLPFFHLSYIDLNGSVSLGS